MLEVKCCICLSGKLDVMQVVGTSPQALQGIETCDHSS